MPGCLLLSLQPYYEEKDVIEHDAFAGKWTSDDGKMLWEFTPTDDGYDVTLNESGKMGAFHVTPFKIGDELFLDFYPDMDVTDEVLSSFYAIHRIPTHSPMHVQTKGEAPVFRIANIDWFWEYLKENPNAARHVMIDDELPILSAEPKELQALLLKGLKVEKAFADLKLVRAAESE